VRKDKVKVQDRGYAAIVSVNSSGSDNKAYVRGYGISASSTSSRKKAVRRAGIKLFGHENFLIRQKREIDVNKSLWVITEIA